MRYIKKKKGATFVWELPEAAKLGERHINGGKMHLSKIIKHSGFYYFTYTHKQKTNKNTSMYVIPLCMY